MNQTVIWVFAILALFIWLVFRPYATAPWKIMALMAVVVAQRPLAARTLMGLSRAHPLKYDYVLQSLDQALGLTAFQVARLFSPGGRTDLLAVYELLSAAMVAWYAIHLVVRGGEPRKLIYAYLIAFLVGCSLYGIVPALGPRYAFGDVFPMGHPSFTPVPAPLEGYPNAMPSLHAATAMLLVLFTARRRWLLPVALIFLAGTVAATLALEHYVIDLVVAVPFACFATEAAYARVIPALKYFGVVLAWLLLIRFASPELAQHPWVLRLFALLSVGMGVRAVAAQWTGSPGTAERKDGPPLARTSPGLPSPAQPPRP